MFEEIDKRTDLTMVEKGELSKEKFKEAYKDYDVYSLIDLIIKKQNKYEPNEKAEDLELLAIYDLIDEKSKEMNLVEINMLVEKLKIRIDFAKNEIELARNKLLDDSTFDKITKSLSEKGLNYTRVFVRYSQKIASEEECCLVEDINRKLKIKEKNNEIKILEDYSVVLKENASKKKY